MLLFRFVCARVFSNMCIDIHVGPSACAHDMHACNVCVCVYIYVHVFSIYAYVCVRKCVYEKMSIHMLMLA